MVWPWPSCRAMDAYGIFVYMEHAASPSFPVRRHPYSASIATLLTVLHILRTTEAPDIGLKLPLSPSTSNLLLRPILAARVSV